MYSNYFATYTRVEPPSKAEVVSVTTEPTDMNYIAQIYEQNLPQYRPQQQPAQKKQTTRRRKVASQTRQTKQTTEVKQQTLKGSDAFERAFAQAVQKNPNVAKYKNFLVRTAKRESGFNSYIQNTAGAPNYGYFQMGQNEIKSTTGLSVQQFRNDPVAQILGAAKLYDNYIDAVKRMGVYDLCRQKGYSDDAIAAGAWLGGPGGVKKFITGKGNPSDSRWWGKNKGTSVGNLMNQFK